MTSPSADKSIFALLILVALSTLAARIANVTASTGETAMLSANDRSRWCTIRALVDNGTYQIDEVVESRHPRTKRRNWWTIDMVRHRGSDQREHYYSSKPPLYPTLLAGQYWLIQQVTGARLETHSFYIMRLMLMVTNGGLLLLNFLLLRRWIQEWEPTNWGRYTAFTFVCFGTLLTSFAVTLNNHLPAAVAAAYAVFAVVRIWQGDHRWRWLLLAGVASAFTAANELPALSLFAAVTVACFWKAPARSLFAFVPAAGLVAAAFFGTNYVAHGSLRPPYAHRSDGLQLAVVEVSEEDSDPSPTNSDQRSPQADEAAIREALGNSSPPIELSDQLEWFPSEQVDRWVLWDPQSETRLAILRTPEGWSVMAWDNWYEYRTSYWQTSRKQGVDRGEPSRRVYAWHATLGHHGIFSLTPIWLLAIPGVLYWLWRGTSEQRGFAVLVISLSLVCLLFYLSRPIEDRNYGGMSCGFRWMLWFAPLWSICLLPTLRWAGGQNWSRWLIYLLLAASIFSAHYSAMNPWTHPWLFRYWSYLGWLGG